MPKDGLMNLDVSNDERAEGIEATIVEKDTVANSVDRQSSFNASSLDNDVSKQKSEESDPKQVVCISYIFLLYVYFFPEIYVLHLKMFLCFSFGASEKIL